MTDPSFFVVFLSCNILKGMLFSRRNDDICYLSLYFVFYKESEWKVEDAVRFL